MKKLLTALFMITTITFAQTPYADVNKEIEAGNYSLATSKINEILSREKLTELEAYNLNFAKDRLERIKLDFSKSKDEVTAYLKKYYPDLNDAMMDAWEKDKQLEMKVIDGKKKYFYNAGPNLFRISKEEKKQQIKTDGDKPDKLDEFVANFLPLVVNSKDTKDNLSNPVKLRLKYTLTVNKNAVPEGEIIRCWLPYPQETHSRQADVKLLSTSPENYLLAPKEQKQRTLYLEKKAEKDKPTEFKMEVAYTAYSEWFNLDGNKIKNYDKNSDLYKTFTKETPPHIVFSDNIKALSEKIIQGETNPYLKAKKIFKWISDNIPWASALEYSTIPSIPEYCMANKHGDCGIKSLLFITLARYNGIPAKWQSGWMLHPVEVNLHDWSEAYFEGIGWVPVDQSFGYQDSENEKIQYFYSNGIDSYRLIVNDDFSKPLYPAKIYPRSETVDFQRGEVEWRGGNLYFNKWKYDMGVEYSSGNDKLK
jgi:hypothetical protein